MKISEVYELAAEQLQYFWRDRGCCAAIRLSLSADTFAAPILNHFGALYGKSLGDYWWPLGHEYRNERIIALLLAAAIARSEGR